MKLSTLKRNIKKELKNTFEELQKEKTSDLESKGKKILLIHTIHYCFETAFSNLDLLFEPNYINNTQDLKNNLYLQKVICNFSQLYEDLNDNAYIATVGLNKRRRAVDIALFNKWFQNFYDSIYEE